MSDETAEEEPSIEEILSSIRQIIADDDEGGGADEAPAESVDEVVGDADDVIDLTEAVEPEPAPEPVAAEPEPEPEPVADEPEPAQEPEIVMEEPEPEPEPEIEEEPIDLSFEEDLEDSILGDSGESAALQGFSELVRKTAVEHEGITVEDIVRTELRPLLKDWLDSNLPSMIQRLVKEELERVSKRALGED